MLRFTALGLRNPSISPKSFNISSLGILQDGCRKSPDSTTRNGDSFYANFDHEITGNGVYFLTSLTSPDLDPVQWYVQASTTNGSSWIPVASSSMMISRDGSTSFSTVTSKMISDARNNFIEIDLRISWEWIVCWVGAQYLTCSAYFLASVAGMTHREESGKAIWVFISLVATTLLFVAAVGYHIRGSSLEAIYQWLNIIPGLCLTLGVWFYESRYLFVVAIFGFMRGGANAIQSVVLFQKPWLNFFAQDFALSTSPVAFLLVILLVIYRQQVIIQAQKLVLPDLDRYITVWNDIKQASSGELLELTTEAIRLSQMCWKSAPRQISHRAHDDNFVAISWNKIFRQPFSTPWFPSMIENICRKSKYLNSMDQLFAQAGCLHTILLSKAREWALEAEGGFPVMFSRCPSFPKYSEVKDDNFIQVKFGKLKSADRSLEKLVRSYNMVMYLKFQPISLWPYIQHVRWQDSSLLVDICRQTIIFSEISGITKCLKVIGNDPDVELVRLKNRMDPAYDGLQSLGYRNVAINLRLVTPQTMALGIDTHICELQLLLQAMAEIKVFTMSKR